jgi:hypothetical protein
MALIRKWVSLNPDIEGECIICFTQSKSGYVTTCCDKFTCQICYLKLRSVCPSCNIALDQSSPHNEQNNLDFDQHMKHEADEFNESVARTLEQEELNQVYYFPGLDILQMLMYNIINNPGDPVDPVDAVDAVDPVDAGVPVVPARWTFVEENVRCGGCQETKIPRDTSHCLTCFRPVEPHEIHAKCGCYICISRPQLEMFTALQADPDISAEDRTFYQMRREEIEESITVYNQGYMDYQTSLLHQNLRN